MSGLRQQLGLTQEDIAKTLGVTTRTVISWENGQHEPRLTVRQMKALCRLLNKQIEELPDNFSKEGKDSE